LFPAILIFSVLLLLLFFSDIDDIFNTLRSKAKSSGLFSTLLAILQNLLLLPMDEKGYETKQTKTNETSHLISFFLFFSFFSTPKE
jgi:hypothetical protein